MGLDNNIEYAMKGILKNPILSVLTKRDKDRKHSQTKQLKQNKYRTFCIFGSSTLHLYADNE